MRSEEFTNGIIYYFQDCEEDRILQSNMSTKAKSKWQESGGRARLAASAATALQRQNISVTSSTVVSSESGDPAQVVKEGSVLTYL